METIKKPSSADSLTAKTDEGFIDTSGIDNRLNRYYSAKQRAGVNRDELRSVVKLIDDRSPRYQSFNNASSKIASCGNYLVFNNYYTVKKVRLSKASFCKQHLICPLCAIRRGSKTLKSYLDRYRVIMQEKPLYRLSMITLTIKNGEDLNERFKHLQMCQRKLIDRRRDWLKKGWGKTEFRKVHGWVGTFEFTNKGKGWHPHSHIMVLHTEDFKYSSLIEEWKSITGDSCNLNVTAAMNPDKPELDFIEVFKYAVKFSDLTAEQNIHAWEILKGKRLLFSGGEFRGVVVPDDLTDEGLDDLDYIEMFYSFGPSKYNLKSTKLVKAGL